MNCDTTYLLKWGKSLIENHREVDELLTYVLKIHREDLYCKNMKISEDKINRFKNLIKRRKNKEPIQYIIGSWDFMNIKLKLNKNVFIPRQETELLVEEFIKKIKMVFSSPYLLLDLGTGSGAVAIALCKNLNSVVYGVDLYEKILRVAHRNAVINEVGKQIKFIKSNLFSCFKNSKYRFNGIVANMPYIPRSELNNLPDDVKCEPKSALDGGNDGLELIMKIVKEAPKYMIKGGVLALEIGYGQAGKVVSMLRCANYENIRVIKDLSGVDRIIISRHYAEVYN